MNSRKTYATGSVNPVLQMVVSVLAIGLVGLLGYRQLDRVLAPRKNVLVLTENITPGEQIRPEHIVLSSMRSNQMSEAVLIDPGTAIGRTLARPKRAGEPLYPSDFARAQVAPKIPLATIVPDGRVVTTLTLTNLTIPYRELQAGDRVDVLAAGKGPAGTRTSVVVVRDAYVLGYLAPPATPSTNGGRGRLMGLLGANPSSQNKPSPPGLMLAVLPKDVLPLAEIDGSGARISLALHNRETVKDGSMLTVQRIPYPRSIDVISGSNRESVKVIH